jgi:hypothetical protein
MRIGIGREVENFNVKFTGFVSALPTRIYHDLYPTPDKPGGLNGSMQHQLEVYLAEFKGQIRLRASIQRKPCPD